MIAKKSLVKNFDDTDTKKLLKRRKLIKSALKKSIIFLDSTNDTKRMNVFIDLLDHHKASKYEHDFEFYSNKA